jgi:hypothetical protein
MQIFYEGDGAVEELARAIDAAPLPALVRDGLSHVFSRSFGGAESVIDSRDMTTTETGDLRITGHLGRAGKLMLAALRAFTASVEQEGHSIPST